MGEYMIYCQEHEILGDIEEFVNKNKRVESDFRAFRSVLAKTPGAEQKRAAEQKRVAALPKDSAQAEMMQAFETMSPEDMIKMFAQNMHMMKMKGGKRRRLIRRLRN